MTWRARAICSSSRCRREPTSRPRSSCHSTVGSAPATRCSLSPRFPTTPTGLRSSVATRGATSPCSPGSKFETVKSREARLARRARPAPPGAKPEPVAGAETAAFRAFAEPQRTILLANRAHAYFDGVNSVIALSDYPQTAWTVKVPYQGFVLALAHEADERRGRLVDAAARQRPHHRQRLRLAVHATARSASATTRGCSRTSSARTWQSMARCCSMMRTRASARPTTRTSSIRIAGSTSPSA